MLRLNDDTAQFPTLNGTWRGMAPERVIPTCPQATTRGSVPAPGVSVSTTSSSEASQPTARTCLLLR